MKPVIDSDLVVEVLQGLGHALDFDEDGEDVYQEDWTDIAAFEAWLEDQGVPEPFRSFFAERTPRHSLECNHGPIYGVADFIDANDPAAENYGHAEATRSLGLFRVGNGPNGDGIVVDMDTGKCGWYPMAGDHMFVWTASSYGKFLKASEDEWDEVPKDWHDAKRRAKS